MVDRGAAPSSEERRDVLKWVLSGSAIAWVASIVYPVFAYLQPPKQHEVAVQSVKAGKVSDLERDSGKIFKFGNKPVIVIRTATDEIKAFAATCTHLDCTVQYRKDFGMIWCACHNGRYDLNGRNVQGPPPRPLDAYRVVVDGDEITIHQA